MNIIKLDAIGSTNTYLKELLTQTTIQNFTVVVAENQFKGRGQRGTVWVGETGSSLTFSVLVKDLLLFPEHVFDLNILVALAVQKALKNFTGLPFSVKWPNDILSVNKKVCGILIENMIKASGDVWSIVGIGINVNQTNFDGLPQATSLAVLTGKREDKDLVLQLILDQLSAYCDRYKREGGSFIWQEYLDCLYKKGIPSAFERPDGERFMGIIQGVSEYGLLEIKREDDTLESYELKQIKLLY